MVTARFTARINTYPFPADAALPLGPVQQEQARRIPAGPDIVMHARHPRTTDRHAVADKAAGHRDDHRPNLAAHPDDLARAALKRGLKIDEWLRWSTSTPTV